MNHSQLENKLAQAIEHASSDNLETILSRCQPQKGTVNVMKKPRFRLNIMIEIAACFLVLLIGVGLLVHFQGQSNAIASVISLDVNPSVQLDVNKKSKIINATALNSEGETILKEMDLKGTQLNVAVNAIVGSLLQHGYIDELANSILVTVEDDDTARGQELQHSITEQVTSALTSAQVNGAVLSQNVNHTNNPLQEKADEYGISVGKATLIDSLVKNSDHLKFEDLTGLTVNELNLLASEKPSISNNITSNGSASGNSYIGIESAKSIALKHAGVDSVNASFTSCEYDYEMGKMVYDIDFMAGTTKYDYDIDAVTGTIIKSSVEETAPAIPNTPNTPVTPPATNPTLIPAEQAKSIALSHAGQSASSVWDLNVELDQKNGVTVYDIDFESSTAEYDYWVNASTGEIVHSYSEPHVPAQPAVTPQPPVAPTPAPAPVQPPAPAQPSGPSISAEQARDLALAQAGLSLGSVYDLEVELDTENGVLVYKIEFEYNGVDYDYEVNASTGAVTQDY